MKNPKETAETNGTKITIKEPKKNFIILYDSVYKNTELTTDEIALIVKLLSCAPTFKPNKTSLSKILNITERRLTKASKGLQKKGYLKIKKHGKTSEWIISQEPQIIDLNQITKENLLNALLDCRCNVHDLKRLHKLKYIDDRLFIEVVKQYAEEIKRIVKTKWIQDED